MQRTWVGWDGGPMMLISEEYFPAWTGAGEREDDGDYREAIEVLSTRSPCVYPVGEGHALLMESSSEPYATWIPYADRTGGVVAMLEFTDDIDEVPEVVLALDADAWTDTGLELTVPGRRQVLVGAALGHGDGFPGSKLTVELAPGTYAVSEA